jgi:hypothetical protein
MKKAFLCSAAVLGACLLFTASDVRSQAPLPYAERNDTAISQPIRLNTSFGKVSLQFIPNHGQVDGQAAFYVQGRDMAISFAAEGLTYVLSRPSDSSSKRPDRLSAPSGIGASGPGMPRAQDQRHGDLGTERTVERWAVKLDFVDARPEVIPEGLEESGAIISYFKGRPEEWRSGVAACSRIVYRDLWPGIDLFYYGTEDRLKYEFVVSPGADPSKIRLAYRGAESVSLTEDGRLHVKTPLGEFLDDAPVAWQEAGGKKVPVDMAYELTGAEDRAHGYGFRVGAYDHARPLVLDPAVIVYCGYIGGSGEDVIAGIAVDAAGNAYVTGYTFSASATFPVAVGPFLIHAGDRDAFVAKVNAAGTALVYCGYLGGSDDDRAYGIALDNEGNACVVGNTGSDESSFPVRTGPDLTYNGSTDVFVAKINAAGTALVYCGYIGGSNTDIGNGIAVDAWGNAYVTGYTASRPNTFPVVVGPRLTHAGFLDAFVAKVKADGTALVYCGYIGGFDDDGGYGIAVDSSGNAYVTGSTSSNHYGFPVMVGPDRFHNGGFDAFVAKVKADGTALVYCGYIGGNNLDYGRSIAVDGQGNVYITGETQSTELTFPVIIGPDLTHNRSTDAFVAKVKADGTALVYCGYIGGSDQDCGLGIAVDSRGNAYITGRTVSSEATFPVSVGPDLTHNGGWDAFLARVNPAGTALVTCGYIGGSGDDQGGGVALDDQRNVYIAGSTDSTESTFPVDIGPALTYNDGNRDAFVAKVSSYDVPGPSISSLVPSGVVAGNPALTLSVTGADFVSGAIVLWDGSPCSTAFLNEWQLNAEIAAADLATGKIAEVTVMNPDGGLSNVLEFHVLSFTMGATPASATVAAGQSATHTVQVTPQFGPFDSAIALSAIGLPAGCTASFSPASVTPGAVPASSTLTLSTRARAGSNAGGLISASATAPPVLGFLLLLPTLGMLLLGGRGRAMLAQAARRRLAAAALVCLSLLIGGCLADGGGGDLPGTGTPAGTYTITIQGASGGLNVSTQVTLVVN